MVTKLILVLEKEEHSPPYTDIYSREAAFIIYPNNLGC